MIENIIIAVLSGLLLICVYVGALLKKKSIDLALKNAQALIDRKILEDKLIQINEDKRLVESEEFMKFMISSRDYAFTYIEATQEALKEFASIIDPIIKYHHTYGTVLGETPQWSQMEEISKAYSDLIKVLPKETES
jgi:hypothetical protein